MTFTLQQIENAARELMLCNEYWDGEPIDPVHFMKLLLQHVQDYGALDHVRSEEEMWNLGKALAAKKAAAAPKRPDPKKDDIVRVLRGQGQGSECKVFWTGMKTYNGKSVLRVGMKTRQGQTLWASADNVEVLK